VPWQKSDRADVGADTKAAEQIVDEFGFAGGLQLSSDRLSTQILRYSAQAGLTDKEAEKAGVAKITFL
jgi:hypothetical protein